MASRTGRCGWLGRAAFRRASGGAQRASPGPGAGALHPGVRRGAWGLEDVAGDADSGRDRKTGPSPGAVGVVVGGGPGRGRLRRRLPSGASTVVRAGPGTALLPGAAGSRRGAVRTLHPASAAPQPPARLREWGAAGAPRCGPRRGVRGAGVEGRRWGPLDVGWGCGRGGTALCSRGVVCSSARGLESGTGVAP